MTPRRFLPALLLLFLVGSVWQMLIATFGTFVSAVVYQMLLNSKKNRP